MSAPKLHRHVPVFGGRVEAGGTYDGRHIEIATPPQLSAQMVRVACYRPGENTLLLLAPHGRARGTLPTYQGTPIQPNAMAVQWFVPSLLVRTKKVSHSDES